MGYGLIEINNDPIINFLIEDAIILNLNDTSLNLNVDPSVNNGQDISESTIITVATNAANGYIVYEKLKSALTSVEHPEIMIPSTGSIPADNYFGYNLTATGSATTLFHNSPAVVGSGSSTTSGTNWPIYYDLKVNYLKPAGIYKAEIEYTVSPSF